MDGGRHHSNRGREDGAGPLLAVALDRSSGVGCFRDHIAADLVTVADAPLGASLQAPLVRACREDLVADFQQRQVVTKDVSPEGV